jgi:hypothetical protein
MANWKGGMKDTGLKSGNDGLSDVKSHVSTFKGLDDGTVHVSREDTIGSSTEPGGGENKGRGGKAENQYTD